MTQQSRNLYLLWSGLVIGVSLLATPAKFLAPDLTLHVALQVGRVTFRVMAAAEVILLTLTLAIVVMNAEMRWQSFRWPLSIAFLLAFQYLGLSPLLGNYTDQIIAGQPGTAPPYLHWLYVAIEITKLGLLMALGLRLGTVDQAQNANPAGVA